MISQKPSKIKTALRAVGPLIPPAPSPPSKPGGEGGPSEYQRSLLANIGKAAGTVLGLFRGVGGEPPNPVAYALMAEMSRPPG